MRLRCITFVWASFVFYIVTSGRRPSGSRKYLSRSSPLKVYAFYYPQFYVFKENTDVHGPNFTEWTLVGKAPSLNVYGRPVKQPIAPLGYYDLRRYEARAMQSKLAKKAGIDGFLFYHYWLENRLVMGDVLQAAIDDGQPSLPFALCWANESWEQKFYGVERRTTLAQKFDKPEAHAAYLVRVFKTKRYIRVNGRPVFVVYRMEMLPTGYLDKLQAYVMAHLDVRMYIVQSLQHLDGFSVPYEDMGAVDAAVEFPPNLGWSQCVKDVALADRPAYCSDAMTVQHTFQPDMYPHPSLSIPLWRGGMSGWDPTPRYPNTTASKGNVENCDLSAHEFTRATETRLRKLLCETNGNEAVYVLFAWNEWGEGSVLEPNTVDGTSMLRGLQSAKANALRRWRQDSASGTCHKWNVRRSQNAERIAQLKCHQNVLIEMCDNALPNQLTTVQFERACMLTTDDMLLTCCELHDKIKKIHRISGLSTRLFAGLELGL